MIVYGAYLNVWLKYGWHSGAVCQMAGLPNFGHLTTLESLA
ncbi:MAG: hypothetical protein WBO24_06730 [Nitrospirales bacterium]